MSDSTCREDTARIPFIAVEYEDLVKSYGAKSEEELLRLQLNAKDLTPEATIALTNELAKRRSDSAARLDDFRNDEWQRDERQRKEEKAKNPGNLFMHFRFGIGRWYLGKAERSYDVGTGMERFKTTVFIFLLWFPLIPTGSYLIERKRGAFTRKITIFRKLSLDWKQVLKIWGVAAACLSAVIWIIKRM
jgi:hypothetical protein